MCCITLRYCLNYKGLPYRTIWVEYPDIAAVCKEIGSPTGGMSMSANPTPIYTLPTIYDPNTKRVVTDSIEIARYLDATYPDTPQVFPEGTEVLQLAFNHAFRAEAMPSLVPLCVPPTHAQLLPRSQEYFRRTREEWFGKKIEELALDGGVAALAGLEKAFATFTTWFEADGKDRVFLMGDKPCFADIIMASYLIWGRVIWGEDSQRWQAVLGWNGGRWAEFMDAMKAYEAIDVGTEYQT